MISNRIQIWFLIWIHLLQNLCGFVIRSIELKPGSGSGTNNYCMDPQPWPGQRRPPLCTGNGNAPTVAGVRARAEVSNGAVLTNLQNELIIFFSKVFELHKTCRNTLNRWNFDGVRYLSIFPMIVTNPEPFILFWALRFLKISCNFF